MRSRFARCFSRATLRSTGLLVPLLWAGATSAAPFTSYIGALTIAIGAVPPLNVIGSGEGVSGGFGGSFALPAGAFATEYARTVVPVLRPGGAIPTTMAGNFRGTQALLPLNKGRAGALNGAGTADITGLGKFATAGTATTFVAARLGRGGGGNCSPPSYTNCTVIYAASPIVDLRFENIALDTVAFTAGNLEAMPSQQVGTYLDVAIAGGGVNGVASLQGAGLVGLFNANTLAPQYPPTALADLAVPLDFAGGGFGYAAVLGAINLTLTGAGWTTGTAAVLANPGTALTPGGGPGFFVTTPMGGQQIASRITAMGFDARTTSGGGPIQFVSPVSIRTNIGGFEQVPTFAYLSVTFVGAMPGDPIPDPDPIPDDPMPDPFPDDPMPDPLPDDPMPDPFPADPRPSPAIPEPGAALLFVAGILWLARRAHSA